MSEPTPLELLARILPMDVGIGARALLVALRAQGLDIDAERLARILEYLVAGEMVTCEAGRYRQVGKLKW